MIDAKNDVSKARGHHFPEASRRPLQEASGNRCPRALLGVPAGTDQGCPRTPLIGARGHHFPEASRSGLLKASGRWCPRAPLAGGRSEKPPQQWCPRAPFARRPLRDFWCPASEKMVPAGTIFSEADSQSARRPRPPKREDIPLLISSPRETVCLTKAGAHGFTRTRVFVCVCEKKIATIRSRYNWFF